MFFVDEICVRLVSVDCGEKSQSWGIFKVRRPSLVNGKLGPFWNLGVKGPQTENRTCKEINRVMEVEDWGMGSQKRGRWGNIGLDIPSKTLRPNVDGSLDGPRSTDVFAFRPACKSTTKENKKVRRQSAGVDDTIEGM